MELNQIPDLDRKNKKIKILYISYDGMTDPLGESQVIPYVEGLTEKGWNFALMSYEKPGRYKQFRESMAERLSRRNIFWKPFRYHKRFSLLATVYDISRGFFYLLFAIPKQKIKIIHCRSYISSILGLLFKKIYGTKFIFDMRGFWADERVEGNIFKKGTVYRFFKWLEKQFLLNADATISLTRNAIGEMTTWKYMTDNAVSKIHHITTCCDIIQYSHTLENKIKKSFNKDSITFLYVGSIGPWHSFETIKSFVRFVYYYLPNSRFKMIVNWGTQQLINHLKEEDYDTCRFTVESLAHNEIPNAIKDADIGFFFIPPHYAKKSSSPTKMGEMLAAGIPIITGHSIGDVDELINKNNVGYIVRKFADEEYKNAVNHVLALLQNDKSKLAYRCLSVAHDYFSLEKGVENYSSIYQLLLTSKK